MTTGASLTWPSGALLQDAYGVLQGVADEVFVSEGVGHRTVIFVCQVSVNIPLNELWLSNNCGTKYSIMKECSGQALQQPGPKKVPFSFVISVLRGDLRGVAVKYSIYVLICGVIWYD